MLSVGKWITHRLTRWLNYEPPLDPSVPSLTNYERLFDEVRPGDVLLIEGRSRASNIIKKITQSSWTHSALYIGNYYQLKNAGIAPDSLKTHARTPFTNLVIEAVLGQGTIVTPLSKYRLSHIRLCRPRSLTLADRNAVIKHTLDKLGYSYDTRHLFDLARFLLPYSVIPRHWLSSLFEYKAGPSTQTICSSMLAEAFMSVHYPVLPVIAHTEDGVRFYKRNIKLYTPKDFDSSPYFDIIKYPFVGLDELAAYRSLPWDQEGLVCNEAGDCLTPFPLSEDQDQRKED